MVLPVGLKSLKPTNLIVDAELSPKARYSCAKVSKQSKSREALILFGIKTAASFLYGLFGAWYDLSSV